MAQDAPPLRGLAQHAYRAQVEAERAGALRQLARARTAFTLLVGQAPPAGALVTPIVPSTGAPIGPVEERPEVRAARAAVAAEDAAAEEAHARLWPTLVLQGGVASQSAGFSPGNVWGMGFLTLRWRGSVAAFKTASAADATLAAAEARRVEKERVCRRAGGSRRLAHLGTRRSRPRAPRWRPPSRPATFDRPGTGKASSRPSCSTPRPGSLGQGASCAARPDADRPGGAGACLRQAVEGVRP